MISSKKLAQLSKRWHGIGAIGRRRVTTLDKDIHPACSSVAGNGHFVIYSTDGSRFDIPLSVPPHDDHQGAPEDVPGVFFFETEAKDLPQSIN
jgi:hypothetical protein